MIRREFITLLGGAAVWPLAAHAQQPARMRRVGMLIGVAENDTETQTWQPPFGSGSTTWAGGSLCRQRMKVRTLWPGQKVDDVAYRCGEEVIRSVPRAW